MKKLLLCTLFLTNHHIAFNAEPRLEEHRSHELSDPTIQSQPKSQILEQISEQRGNTYHSNSDTYSPQPATIMTQPEDNIQININDQETPKTEPISPISSQLTQDQLNSREPSTEPALPLSDQFLSEDDFSLSKPKVDTMEHMQKIEEALKKLPEANRPKDIPQTLRFIRNGKIAWNKLQEGKIYDAIAHNMLPSLRQDVYSHWLKQAYNTTDEEFWEIIKNNALLKAKASHHDIPFTLESLKSPENNMYFRATYTRTTIKDPAVLQAYKVAYEQTIVDTQWHLYAHSVVQEGRGFTSGMITMNDPGQRLFKFLDGYGELASPKYKIDSGTISSLIRTKVYTRHSSHWAGQVGFEGKQFGIDIQGRGTDPLRILPGNKSHLLFGVRNNGMIFIKWEDYGTTFNPIAGDYSVFPHLKGYFEKHGKEDDPMLHRREKTPEAITAEFKKLYPETLTKNQQDFIESHGIAAMIDILKQHASSKVDTFKHYLVHTKGYQHDTLETRKGGEVILDPTNII